MTQEMARGSNIVVLRDERVLLLQRDSGRWEFPGGTFDAVLDDDMAGSASRELREETGLYIAKEGLTEFWSHMVPADIHKGVVRPPLEEVYYFGHAALAETVSLSDEHIDSRWLDQQAATGYLTAPQTDALDRLP